jgi:hypothetical protein
MLWGLCGSEVGLEVEMVECGTSVLEQLEGMEIEVEISVI